MRKLERDDSNLRRHLPPQGNFSRGTCCCRTRFIIVCNSLPNVVCARKKAILTESWFVGLAASHGLHAAAEAAEEQEGEEQQQNDEDDGSQHRVNHKPAPQHGRSLKNTIRCTVIHNIISKYSRPVMLIIYYASQGDARQLLYHGSPWIYWARRPLGYYTHWILHPLNVHITSSLNVVRTLFYVEHNQEIIQSDK